MVEWRSTKNGIPRTYVERSGVSHTPFSKRNFHGESLCGKCLWISTARNGSKFLSTPIVAFLSLYTVCSWLGSSLSSTTTARAIVPFPVMRMRTQTNLFKVKASVIRTFVMERKCPDYGGSTVYPLIHCRRSGLNSERKTFLASVQVSFCNFLNFVWSAEVVQSTEIINNNLGCSSYSTKELMLLTLLFLITHTQI